MPAAVAPKEIGIKRCDYTLAQRNENSYKLDPVAPLLDKDGGFAYGAATGGDGEWSIDGLGDIPDTLALGENDPGIHGMEGGKILTLSMTKGETLKNWNSWSVKGEHCPFADTGA
jgi:hypothetical protein